MDEIKCKMVGCDYAEYDSESQSHICTYGPMCKILVLEEENIQLKKRNKCLHDQKEFYKQKFYQIGEKYGDE